MARVTDRVERDHHKPKATLFVEEKLRRYSQGATRQIALRRGRGLNMWVGCGYPKSGTVWLCKQMSTALGLPFPVDFQMPIMMSAVLHGHWKYDERYPPTVYIRRDGRDTVVSMYFHWTRGLRMKRDPRYTAALADIFTKLYGPSFDPDDVAGNLPKYIEYQMTVAPTTHGVTWQDHIRDWWERPGVGHVSYEELLTDPVDTLYKAMHQASPAAPDRDLVELAVERHRFARETGRSGGAENRNSFQRKGVAGDWRAHFTREAAEAFDAFAGQDLIDFGYESGRDWYDEL